MFLKFKFKGFYITMWLFVFGILIGGVVYAQNTRISNTGINTGEINNIYYVEANNVQDLQNKINLANSKGGGIVILPPNSVYVTEQNTPLILYSNIELKGSGWTSIINITESSRYITAQGGSNNIIIRDLKIESNNVVASLYSPINMGFASFINGQMGRVEIDNVWITDARRGIVLNATDIKITNSFFDNVGDGIVILENRNSPTIHHVNINNNRIINRNWNLSTSNNYGEGIDINLHQTPSKVLVSNNYISGFGEDGIDVNSEYSIIEGNIINLSSTEPRTTGGITVCNNPTNAKTTINNNIIMNIQTGYGISSGCNGPPVKANSTTITDNILIGTSAKTGNGTIIWYSENVVISGNSYKDLNTAIEIRTNTTNISPLGNIFSNVNTEISGINIFSGSGNGFACFTSSGRLYRSDSSCS